jgi:TRAP-type mannitol/chloroaromatic compound transport system substrate-binding protein
MLVERGVAAVILWSDQYNNKELCMKRRQILAAAGVGLAATALAGCKQEAETAAKPQEGAQAQTFNWKMVTSWPKNFPGVGVGAERFA